MDIKHTPLVYSTGIKTKYFLNKKKAKQNRLKNIVTFHTHRCGSTVLGDLLNQHPEIHWDGEIYDRLTKYCTNKMKKKPVKYIDYRKNYVTYPYYGMEVTIVHLIHFFKHLKLTEFIKILKSKGFDNFIILERKNYLRRMISGYILFETMKFKSKNSNPKLNKITLPVIYKDGETIIDKIEFLKKFYSDLNDIMKNEKHLKLYYEDDILTNPVIACEKVIDFLDIKMHSPNINLKKQNPFPIKDILINFEEVEKHLKNTKFEWMLYQ